MCLNFIAQSSVLFKQSRIEGASMYPLDDQDRSSTVVIATVIPFAFAIVFTIIRGSM